MIDEWWGRTFEGRGSLPYDQMPDVQPSTLRKVATADLLTHVASEGSRSAGGLAAQMELRRREAWTARAALTVSVVALTVSALSAIFKG